MPYLPARGEPGPAGGRPWRRLRITPHRATSEVLAGAYPFLAEEGLGSAGILIGQDAWSGAAFCYDPWVLYQHGVLTNPNIFLAGQIGRGKSTLAKSLAARCIAFGRRVYVPGDPKGEWTRRRPGRRRPGHRARRRPAGPAQPPRRRPPPRRHRRRRLAGPGRPAAPEPARPPWPKPPSAGPRTGRTHRPRRRPRHATHQRPAPRSCPPSSTPCSSPPSHWRGSTIGQLRRRRTPRRPRPGPPRPRRPGRPVRRALHRRASTRPCPWSASTSPHISGSDTLLGLVMTCASTWMEAALARPGRRAAPGGLRRGLAAHGPARPARPHASPMEAVPGLGARQPAWSFTASPTSTPSATPAHEARGLAQGLLGDTATRILYNEPYDEATAARRSSA